MDWVIGHPHGLSGGNALLVHEAPRVFLADGRARRTHMSGMVHIIADVGQGARYDPEGFGPVLLLRIGVARMASDLPGDKREIGHVDIRPDIGATVSIVFQYLEAMNLTPDADLATAIFYGVRTDTRALSRDSSLAEQYAYFKLLSLLDHKKLVQVEQAGLPREYFQAFSKGLLSTKVYQKIIVTYQGEMHRPDFSAEMADLLIRHEDIQAVLCMGVHDQVLFLSMRTTSDELDAGNLIQQLVEPPAKAGGHGKSAGGQVPLGSQTAEQLAAEVEKRFVQVMGEKDTWELLLI